jgi:hypothetical protein
MSILPSAPRSAAAYAAGARLGAVLARPAVLFFVVALSAWLLHGFNIGPVNDGWTFFGGDSAAGEPFEALVGARVFINIPTFLGLSFVPHGFQGWQWVMVAVTFARGLLFFAIIRRLVPDQPLFWLACGLIAIFHPADDSFFWAECVGPHFGLDLALGACLTAIIYLQRGPRWALWATWLLQFLACFTYSSCLPLMMALPFGAWLLSRTQGPAWDLRRLLEIVAPILLLAAVYAFLVLSGFGRAGVVASLSIDGVLAGYRHESGLLLRKSVEVFSGFQPIYLAFAVVPALLASYVATRMSREESARLALRSQILIFAGLIVLAAVSYLPFAISTVRFGSKRQLMAPGIFLYSAGLFVVFVALPGWFRGRRWGALAVLAFAGMTVVVGLEKREIYVSQYRTQEQLLAGIAALVPAPPPDAVIMVHVANRRQASALAGLYNRVSAFSGALRFMYNDYRGGAPIGIVGGFTSFGRYPELAFKGHSLSATHYWHPDYEINASYSHLILIGYDARGHAKLLDRSWLQEFAPKGTELPDYRPAVGGSAPDPASNICSMLEKGYRPSYCSN